MTFAESTILYLWSIFEIISGPCIFLPLTNTPFSELVSLIMYLLLSIFKLNYDCRLNSRQSLHAGIMLVQIMALKVFSLKLPMRIYEGK